MPISGMTGFAKRQGEWAGRSWTWEIRSVNGRGLDVKVRTPPGHERVEVAVREQSAKRFVRGNIQAVLGVSTMAAQGALTLDRAWLDSLLAAGEHLIASGRVAPPRWDGLMQVRGVIISRDADQAEEPQDEGLEQALIAGAASTLDDLVAARAQEGSALLGVLAQALDRIDALVARARAEASAAPAALASRMMARLAALAPEIQLDPARLAQEAALLASRADILEELDRLVAHTHEGRTLLNGAVACGRRLDFLSQELNREANTLCSKATELELTRIGLDLKTTIDQFREQCANVE